MADNLRVFGKPYNSVNGLKMRDANGNEIVYTAGGSSGLPEVGLADIGKSLLVSPSQYASHTIAEEQTITLDSNGQGEITNWDGTYFTAGTNIIASVTIVDSVNTGTIGTTYAMTGEVTSYEGVPYCDLSTDGGFEITVGIHPGTLKPTLMGNGSHNDTLTISVATETMPSSAEWSAGNTKYIICEPQELTATTSEDDDPKYVLAKNHLSPSYVHRPDPVQMLLVFDETEYIMPWNSDWNSWTYTSGTVSISKNGSNEYWLYSETLSMEGTHTIALYGLVDGGTIAELPSVLDTDNGTVIVRNGVYEIGAKIPASAACTIQNNTVNCYEANRLIEDYNTFKNVTLYNTQAEIQDGGQSHLGYVMFHLYGAYNIYDSQLGENTGYVFIFYDMLGNRITLPCYVDNPWNATGTYTPAS